VGKKELEALLTRPEMVRETVKQILGDYDGPFTLGITKINNLETNYKLLLILDDELARNYKSHASVNLNGTEVPLEVLGGLQALSPY
jgi:hypothetical protein